MKYVERKVYRSLTIDGKPNDEIGKGFDRKDCWVSDGKLYIPAKIGVFEDADLAGMSKETLDLIESLSRTVYGNAIEQDREDGLFPKGTPMSAAVGLTLAFKLAWQKKAVEDRKPAALGKLSDAEFASARAFAKRERPDETQAIVTAFASDDDYGIDRFRREIVALAVSAGWTK